MIATLGKQHPFAADDQPMVVAVPCRAPHLAVATGLAHVGLFEAERVAQVRKGTGYHDMVKDLMALSAMYRASWPSVPEVRPEVYASDHCPVAFEVA